MLKEDHTPHDAMLSATLLAELSPQEKQRYARQIVIPGVGEVGQRRLHEAKVLIVGLGGLGSPVALYLAAAGVGQIALLESDTLEESNLQRQILYNQQGVHQSKVELAAARILDLNPLISVTTLNERLSRENAPELLSGYDLILSCVDNRAARQEINSACLRLGTAWVDGAVIRYQGTVMTYLPGEGPCYACLHSEDEAEPPPAAELGVWGAAAGVIGSLQAMEAIKYLLGERDHLLIGRMLWCDLQRMQMQTIEMQRREDCPTCGIES